jgi:hypothetical protein
MSVVLTSSGPTKYGFNQYKLLRQAEPERLLTQDTRSGSSVSTQAVAPCDEGHKCIRKTQVHQVRRCEREWTLNMNEGP